MILLLAVAVAVVGMVLPDLLALTLLSTIVLVALDAAIRRPEPARTPETIRRLPTRYERRSRTRWVPSLGVTLHGWPPRPRPWLGLFRWRP